MIKEKISYDHSINEEGIIHVRKISRFMDGDVQVSKSYHRHVIDPDMDNTEKEDRKTQILTKELLKEDFKVKPNNHKLDIEQKDIMKMRLFKYVRKYGKDDMKEVFTNIISKCSRRNKPRRVKKGPKKKPFLQRVKNLKWW